MISFTNATLCNLYGQQSDVRSDDESTTSSTKLSVAQQQLYDVYFRLDDSSSVQSESSMNSSSVAPMDDSIPFHDCIYGQESGLDCLDDDDDNFHLLESKKAPKRIPRCTVQSRPVITLVLFATMLARRVHAYFSSA